MWHKGSLSRAQGGVQIMDLEPSNARLVCGHKCRSDWTVRVQLTFYHFPKSTFLIRKELIGWILISYLITKNKKSVLIRNKSP